ncbi:hypothetical protein [Sulfitobacter aestuariivivens]|uniref:Uncharacterized protein n=1 Tax=Sulfitobacter aestuariivivens TaxID=2766981 RepID=A0A927HHW2_9RHOB|nr:hypothetical protein [Sulfitobacter aestuariivivens]MBD3665635.1 hypothetical protein [Sulfitobacter aestuariivivens]
MTNIITFKNAQKPQKSTVAKRVTDNVVSLIEWKAKPRALRTPNGIFFITAGGGAPLHAA